MDVKVAKSINFPGHEKEDCEGLPKGEDAEVRIIFWFRSYYSFLLKFITILGNKQQF